MYGTIRRSEYNRVNDKIRTLKKCMEMDEASIRRLNGQQETSYSRSQITKMSESNAQRQLEIKALEERLEDIKAGTLDHELEQEMHRGSLEAREKTRITRQKKLDAIADKKVRSEISKAYYQAQRKADRQVKYDLRSQKRSYQHFVKACSSIPDYMLRNLAEMPNNKGYFWKSVACYGELPPERGEPIVLFDRKRGGIMVIHEWTPQYYRVYHKKDKKPKSLISCTRRKSIVISDSFLPDREEFAEKKTRRRFRSKNKRSEDKWQYVQGKQRNKSKPMPKSKPKSKPKSQSHSKFRSYSDRYKR